MRAIILVGVLALAACANVDIQRVTADNDATVHGIRYWRPAPYLSVTGDKNGACIARLIYLPNTKEQYVITPHGGFGTITFKPTLADGWNLTALDATIDSKTSATDVLGAIAKIPGLAAKDVKESTPGMKPGIYRIMFDNDGDVSLSPRGAYAGGTPCLSMSEPPPAKP